MSTCSSALPRLSEAHLGRRDGQSAQSKFSGRFRQLLRRLISSWFSLSLLIPALHSRDTQDRVKTPRSKLHSNTTQSRADGAVGELSEINNLWFFDRCLGSNRVSPRGVSRAHITVTSTHADLAPPRTKKSLPSQSEYLRRRAVREQRRSRTRGSSTSQVGMILLSASKDEGNTSATDSSKTGKSNQVELKVLAIFARTFKTLLVACSRRGCEEGVRRLEVYCGNATRGLLITA